MPAIVIVLVLLLALGVGAKSESPQIKQNVNFRVEVDSKGNASTLIGLDATVKDPNGNVEIRIIGK